MCRSYLVGDGYEMAEAIRRAGLETAVLAGSECTSECIMLFAAGVERHHDPNNRAGIGVHAASKTIDGTENSDGTLFIERELKRLGAADAIIGKLAVSCPNNVVTEIDLRSGARQIGSFRNAINSAPPK
jgi:hypothetical protein